MISPELLRRYPFFGGLTDAQISGIAMIADEVGFMKGDLIGEQGKPASKFYLLTEGSVDLLYSSGEQGRIRMPSSAKLRPARRLRCRLCSSRIASPRRSRRPTMCAPWRLTRRVCGPCAK